METRYNAFKHFSIVLTMHKVGSVLVLSPMLFKTKSLNSVGEEFNKNGLIYFFVKSNLNSMYQDLRLGSQMKINSLLSKLFTYCSIKLSFLSFENVIKNYKSSLNFIRYLFIGIFCSVFKNLRRLSSISLYAELICMFFYFLFSTSKNLTSSMY